MKLKLIFIIFLFLLYGCGGGSGDSNGEDKETNNYIIIASKTEIESNGKDITEFKLYDKEYNVWINNFDIYINGILHDSQFFMTETAGEYEIYAEYNKNKTEKIIITAYSIRNPEWEKKDEFLFTEVNKIVNYEKFEIEAESKNGKLAVYQTDNSWEFESNEIFKPILFDFEGDLNSNKIKFTIDIEEYMNENIKLFLGYEGVNYSYNKNAFAYSLIENYEIKDNKILFELNFDEMNNNLLSKRAENTNRKFAISAAKELNLLSKDRFNFVSPYGEAITDKIYQYFKETYNKLINEAGISEDIINEVWTKPITIKITDTKDTALYIGSPYGRNNDSIEISYAALGNDMLKIASAHEFFHFIQACYEGSMANIISSDYTWIDEATAITVEGIMKNDMNYVADLANNYKYFFVQGISGYYVKNDYVPTYENEVGRHGYGASFFIRFLLKKKGDYKIIGKIYDEIHGQSLTNISSMNALKKVVSDNFDKSFDELYDEFIDELFAGKLGEDFIKDIDNIEKFSSNSNYKYLIKTEKDRSFKDSRDYFELSSFLYKIRSANKSQFEFPQNTVLRVKYKLLEGIEDKFVLKILDNDGKIVAKKNKNENFLNLMNYEKYQGENIFLLFNNLEYTNDNFVKTKMELECSIPPIINEISKLKANVGEKIEIRGYNFGKIQDKGYIKMDNEKILTVDKWSNEYIEFKVPENLSEGKYKIIAGAYDLESEEEIYLEVGEDRVVFDDSEFEKLIRYYIGKDTGIITPEDMEKITRIEDEHFSITSIRGIEYCKNITHLTIARGYGNSTNVTDLSYVADLTKLKLLFIAGNMKEINSLKKLTNLEILKLDGCLASDISVVANMKKLKELKFYPYNVYENPRVLNDLSPVSGLTLLEDLYIGEYSLVDISALSGLTNMKYLNIMNNNIKDISALQNMKDLEVLNMYRNEILGIKSLAGMTKLRDINMQYNQVSDVEILSTLTGLKSIIASDNQITKFPDLSNCKELYSYDFSTNKINNIDEIKKADVLEYVNLYKNEITSLSGMNGMEKIKSLSVFENKLTSLNGIETLINLESLYASKNNIKDISVLENMQNIQYLNFEENEIEDISIVENLNKLKSLNIKSNPKLYTSEKYYNENGQLKDENGKYDYIDTENHKIIKKLKERGCEVNYNLINKP